MNLAPLQKQIQTNCDISDARHAGLYSLCGLLLRLRDLYKWEHALLPWQEPDPAVLLEWVETRETHWETVAQHEFQALTVDNQSFDPFDVANINLRLRPLGVIYGAGYVMGMKPSFFLGEVTASRTLGDLQIDVIGRELARDIYTTPAMRQGPQIFARTSAMLFFLWDQILELRPSTREALVFALRHYGLEAEALRQQPARLASTLHHVAARELEAWIYHEVGEVHEQAFDGQVWHEIVATYANSLVEIFARVTKDLLADTHPEGLLGHIIRHRRHSTLGFYVAFMRPFTRAVFPEITEAFRQFRLAEQWAVIDEARSNGYAKAASLARQLVEIHEKGSGKPPEWAIAEIQERLITPLGIPGTALERADTKEQPDER